MRYLSRTLVTLFIAAISLTALAHHSPALFDLEKRVSITGIVESATFRNPHGVVMMKVKNARSGAMEEWHVETSAANLLRRRGWDFSKITPGTSLTAVGHPHRERANYIYLRAVTLENGPTFGDPDGKDQALD